MNLTLVLWNLWWTSVQKGMILFGFDWTATRVYSSDPQRQRRVHVHVCACFCAWVCAGAFVCMHACVRACVHACVCVRVCVCARARVPVHAYFCACVRLCLCVHANIPYPVPGILAKESCVVTLLYNDERDSWLVTNLKFNTRFTNGLQFMNQNLLT